MDSNLSLSSCARLAFIGLNYVYIVKFIDTLWHGIFANPTISFLVVSLNILAGIAHFLFFYKLQSLSKNSGILAHTAGWIGVLGALINIFPKLLALSVFLQFYFSFNLIRKSHAISILGPWLGAVMLFCCCVIFSLLSVTVWSNKSRYFLIGAVGYLTLTGTFSILVLNFFSSIQVNWQVSESGTSLPYFIVSASFSFLCIAYFFAGFFSGNENIENDASRL